MQLSLFDPVVKTVKRELPEGVRYIRNFISPAEEQILVRVIDNTGRWDESINRRRKHFGLAYYGSEKTEIPAIIEGVARRLGRLHGRIPEQVSVNEYLPGQGIALHVDREEKRFDIIYDISLLSGIGFIIEDSGNNQKYEIYLEPRSLLVLEKRARYECMHGIAPRKADRLNGVSIQRQRRIGLIFRPQVT